VAGMLYFSEFSDNFSWIRKIFEFKVYIKFLFPYLFTEPNTCHRDFTDVFSINELPVRRASFLWQP
jgi:hypothetical protein